MRKGGGKMPVSEKQKKYQAKYDRENWEYITIKAHKGSRERIKKAAEASGESINGFMRRAVNAEVEKAIGEPMEQQPPAHLQNNDCL
jgi:predicted HicB family RNase H-like nuclease